MVVQETGDVISSSVSLLLFRYRTPSLQFLGIRFKSGDRARDRLVSLARCLSLSPLHGFTVATCFASWFHQVVIYIPDSWLEELLPLSNDLGKTTTSVTADARLCVLPQEVLPSTMKEPGNRQEL